MHNAQKYTYKIKYSLYNLLLFIHNNSLTYNSFPILIINNKFLREYRNKICKNKYQFSKYYPSSLFHYLILIPISFPPPLKETFIKRASPSQEKNSLFPSTSPQKEEEEKRDQKSKRKRYESILWTKVRKRDRPLVTIEL